MSAARKLKVFRTIGLLLIAAELWRYFGVRGEGMLVTPEVLFSVFEGYPRPSRVVAHFLGPVMGACLIFAAFGRVVRPALATFLCLYAYTLCLILSDYNNHHYLYWLVAFCFFLIGPIRETVPNWTYSLLRFQILVVFLFAALAKLNLEWLEGLPLEVMLSNRDYPREGLALLLAYAGLFIDLIVAPLLLLPKTRVIAAVILITFHLGNSYLFDIATFPFFMIASLVLFFDPAPAPVQAKEPGVAPRLRLFLLGYCLIQLILPLRHHLIPGDVNWDRGGHRLAWRMMLNHSLGRTSFLLEDGAGRTRRLEFPYTGLNQNQIIRLSLEPESIWRYGLWLKDQEGVERVRVETAMSWNGREEVAFFQPGAEIDRQSSYQELLNPSPRNSEPWYLLVLQFSLLGGWLATVGRKLYQDAEGSALQGLGSNKKVSA